MAHDPQGSWVRRSCRGPGVATCSAVLAGQSRCPAAMLALGRHQPPAGRPLSPAGPVWRVACSLGGGVAILTSACAQTPASPPHGAQRSRSRVRKVRRVTPGVDSCWQPGM